MKCKNILISGLLFLGSSAALAQNDNDSARGLSGLSFRERLQFHIGGGLMFGNTYTNINIQPQIGYRITPRLSAGIGANFQYYKNTYFSSDPFIIYGGNAFSRYLIGQGLFAQAEYQRLSFDGSWGDYALIGGGYIPSRGVYVSAYYLLHYPANRNIYGAPYLIRVGFII